jgi:hypothetical protein
MNSPSPLSRIVLFAFGSLIGRVREELLVAVRIAAEHPHGAIWFAGSWSQRRPTDPSGGLQAEPWPRELAIRSWRPR